MRAAKFVVMAILSFAPMGCGSAWTARACASNPDGNCRATDTGQPHTYAVKSTVSATDVAVHEPQCASGIGEVDVQVQDRDNLQLTIYCLVDQPAGTMKLSSAPAPAASSGGR
jgi:hypothetical protein